MAVEIVSAEEIRQAFFYDPGIGVFIRRERSSSRAPAGVVVGTKNSGGYLQIRYRSMRFLAHRLAWLYVTGEWPVRVIDHINGVRDDNRIANLRDVSQQTNAENLRLAQARTASGFLGVHIQRRNTIRYLAQIVTNGKLSHIGSFATPAEAHSAYLKAKRELHEGCTI